MADTQKSWGTGRRKTSVARVQVVSGSGNVAVNGRELDRYFPREEHRNLIRAPLRAAHALNRFDVCASVRGGGPSGQAGAVVMGLARALRRADASLEAPLKEGGYFTRDSRMSERKKYGRKKARKSFQFSKR